MFGSQNKVEKFGKNRINSRQEMKMSDYKSNKKNNKTQRGNDRWTQVQE